MGKLRFKHVTTKIAPSPPPKKKEHVRGNPEEKTFAGQKKLKSLLDAFTVHLHQKESG